MFIQSTNQFYWIIILDRYYFIYKTWNKNKSWLLNNSNNRVVKRGILHELDGRFLDELEPMSAEAPLGGSLVQPHVADVVLFRFANASNQTLVERRGDQIRTVDRPRAPFHHTLLVRVLRHNQIGTVNSKHKIRGKTVKTFSRPLDNSRQI